LLLSYCNAFVITYQVFKGICFLFVSILCQKGHHEKFFPLMPRESFLICGSDFTIKACSYSSCAHSP
ncbi:MAG: hypothetical protein NC092_05505, partial [Butyrivibrio sp.]|nr:hypothetical protein [Butyrivibrio sp.]